MPTPQKAMTINYLKFRPGTNITSPPSKRTSTMCVVPCCQLKFFRILLVAQDIIQKSDQASNNGLIHGVKTLENYKNDVPKETCERQLFGVGYLQEVPVSYRVILVLWT